MVTKKLTIEGMSCNHCVNNVATALTNTNGVLDAEILLADAEAIVHMEKDIPFEQLKQIISDSGHYELIREELI